jgi:hypothetical protein
LGKAGVLRKILTNLRKIWQKFSVQPPMKPLWNLLSQFLRRWLSSL